jgi:hypothetical protein
MEQLQAMLKSGIIPSKFQLNKQQQNNGKYNLENKNSFHLFFFVLH